MVRNLMISNTLPLMVARFCRKKTEPLPASFSAAAVASRMGLNRISPVRLNAISNARFRKRCISVISVR